MIRACFVFLFACGILSAAGQPKKTGYYARILDSLKYEITAEKNDTTKLVLNYLLFNYYTELKPDSARYYAEQQLALARKMHSRLDEAMAMDEVGYNLYSTGDYTEALQTTLAGIAIAEEKEAAKYILPEKYLKQMNYRPQEYAPETLRKKVLGSAYHHLGHIYTGLEQYDKALTQYIFALSLYNNTGNRESYLPLMNIGRTYLYLAKYDSAFLYEKKAYDAMMQSNKKYLSNVFSNMGYIYLAQRKIPQAKQSFYNAVVFAKEQNNTRSLISAYQGLASFFLAVKQIDSSLWYGRTSLRMAKSLALQKVVYGADTLLSKAYKAKGNLDSAYYFQEAGMKLREQMFSSQKTQQLQSILNAENQRRTDIETARTNYNNRLQRYLFSGGIVFLLVIAVILFRNNRQRKKTNAVLEEQKKELELQKKEAELHNRNLEIEASLERVRTKTMAMHGSDDVSDTAIMMFKELEKLGVVANRAGILIYNDDDAQMEIWTAGINDNNARIIGKGKLDVDMHPLLNKAYAAWKDNAVDFYYHLHDDDLVNYYHGLHGAAEYMYELPAVLPSKQTSSIFYFPEGGLFAFSTDPLPTEAIDIFKRFAGVFALTYRRFLDLQKAEAQVREAQVEGALEKVRSRTMAMHHSDELKFVIMEVTAQLLQLGFKIDNASFNIIPGEKSRDMNLWLAVPGKEIYPSKIYVPYYSTPMMDRVYDAIDNEEDFVADILTREEKDHFFTYAYEHTDFKNSTEERKHMVMQAKGVARSTVITKHIVLGLQNYNMTPYSEEENAILKRTAQVFEQAFTRFLDLQKAEAQTREAKIEVALERVRSRAMAMQNSEELNALIGTVFTELTKLDIVLTRCLIMIYDPATNDSRWWMVNSEAPEKPMDYLVKCHEHEPYLTYLEGWKQRALKWKYILEGDVKNKWDDFLFSETELSLLPGFVIAGMKQPERVYLHASFNNFGNLTLATTEPLSDEQFEILLRFAKVFDLTYTRFNDLKQAEQQAREATIEAALEKVRGKAMAMHNSNDLSVTASMIFTELRKLGITPIRCGVGIVDKENVSSSQLYSAVSSDDGDGLALMGAILLKEHTVLENIYRAWLNNEDYFPELSGEVLTSYYRVLSTGLSLPSGLDIDEEKTQYGHFISCSVGCLYAWSETRYNDTEIKIIRRFASIVDLTFRRYIELQQSEANAKNAIRQASLDRVRADIASMRTTSDLEKITPLIWNELNILGIPFIRCGVFIMDEELKTIHTFLSTPEGKAIAVFDIPFDTPGNIANVLDNWQHKKIYTDHWDQAAFTSFANALVKAGALTSSEQYLSTLPRDGFYLHFVPFQQGMLYVGNTLPLDEDEINLLQSVAGAFSTAYARYEDFNKLEIAKQQVDNTIKDLRSAQQQLVQAEKMASLGELTAGIAHEIQNPLNFVNNFSEVSAELADEMQKELAAGNKEEAIVLAEDIKQNLTKIVHHGKRADSIVKGMLQHSRSSTGQKELTDINALADEYLRLSYHGLRAKDKSFNAEMKTNWDESLPKLNLVSQDVGRVILNLFTNAFYAVNEKAKKAGSGYTPLVSVSTKRAGDKIEVSIKDNGTGIPEKVLNKIYQPFFTTKPTGEGTGLGLSLSYDIITKGHDGEIKVETKEGEGSEFIIQIPFQPS
ncbi:MAG: hypothetical protein JWN76_2340 [Chitinophagaceae bacterium]|nr:hypothetical protein [Chitinophagaceae bacterium]